VVPPEDPALGAVLQEDPVQDLVRVLRSALDLVLQLGPVPGLLDVPAQGRDQGLRKGLVREPQRQDPGVMMTSLVKRDELERLASQEAVVQSEVTEEQEASQTKDDDKNMFRKRWG